ncbi:unnamed protein product [Arctia plantaginis]|uniref:Glutathione S-transferase n=1 Tax=Arctia plantaginis TaxID=874455 RepID=A0A8S0ZUW9_ARCPL|nr:unnamed protein product [Arctia plantaginis]
MAKEFHYFDLNGLGESIRYLLHYTNQQFKDVRYDLAKWPDANVKATLEFGVFPLYKEGDHSLNQSLTIAKYVARGTSLIPDDPWEQAVAENLAFTVYDYWSNVKPYIMEPDLEKKYQIKVNVLENTIDFYFSRFEKIMKENGGFFIGKLSWAEFVLCGLVESTELFLGIEMLEKYPTLSWAEFVLCGLVESTELSLGIEMLEKYPTVKAALNTIRTSPGVKEYIARRGTYKLPYGTKKYKGLDILDNAK